MAFSGFASEIIIMLACIFVVAGTLIGTSTNLASSGLIVSLGQTPYSLFEFVIPGVLLTAIGIVYLTLVGRRIIPERESDDFAQVRVGDVLLMQGSKQQLAGLARPPDLWIPQSAAAALVLLPIAVSTAEMLDVDARPFVIIVTLSASLSFITPLAPASLLVFGVGKYRFSDFMKVGLPLTLIVIALLVFLVPLLWPF